MKMLYKELKLAASPLSFVFIVSSLLTFVPGYPILLGAFFTTLGIFYSFQTTRENNDIYYSLLLPVSKADVVKSKYVFCVLIEMCSFFVMVIVTALRMSFLNDAPVYVSNALMGANLTFLGFALMIFALFNFVFIKGFFKTAYYFGKPFIAYCVVSVLIITLAEILHYVPFASSFFSLGFENAAYQFSALTAGAAMFVLLTLIAFKRSVNKFETIDI